MLWLVVLQFAIVVWMMWSVFSDEKKSKGAPTKISNTVIWMSAIKKKLKKIHVHAVKKGPKHRYVR